MLWMKRVNEPMQRGLTISSLLAAAVCGVLVQGAMRCEAQTSAAQYGLVITNFAGGGAACAAATNSVGDGCPATQATVNSPHIGDFDAAGDFYFTDSATAANAGKIRRVDVHTGIITTVAGGAATVCAGATNAIGDGCPATQATLNVPHAVKLDTAGNLYIADSSNNRIRFVNAQTGVISTIVGNGTLGTAPFSNTAPPFSGAAALNGPNDLAIDSAGNLYISQAASSGTTSYFIALVTAVNGHIDSAASLAYTLAGTGTLGYSGDSGASTAAKINSGRGVVLDSAGNLYFSDYVNDRIRKITSPFQGGTLNLAGSMISTYAGTGGAGTSGDGNLATAATVNSPEAVGIDAAGNLYIDCVNSGSAFIRKVTAATGIITSIAGTGAYGNTGDGGLAMKATINGEIGVSVDPYGNIYIVDTGNNRVRKLSLNTTFPSIGVAASSTAQSVIAQLNQALTVQSISVSAAYGDFGAGTVSGCTVGSSNASGSNCSTPVTFHPVFPGLRSAPLVFTDGGSNVVSAGLTGTGLAPAASFSPATISTIIGTGTAGSGNGGGVAVSAQVSAPRGGFVDAAKTLYFADAGNHLVRKLALTTGTISTVAGTGTAGFAGDGSAATSALLSTPTDVVEDATGNLYIADSGNNRIRMISVQTGLIHTIAGTGTAGFAGDGGSATAAQVSAPTGLALDTLGNLYVADAKNHVIRRIVLATNLISTIAGTGTAGYTGDAGAATAATLHSPGAIAVDGGGNLYIADTGNSVVRSVSVTGTIATVAGAAGLSSNSGDGGAATAAGLLMPTDVAVDASGDLFIMAGNRVRHTDAAGVITTVAGTGVSGAYQGESGAATAAVLGSSADNLILDGTGNFLISATSSNRVLAVSATQATQLTFAAQTAGTTSTAQVVNVMNNGNQQLTFTGLTVASSFTQQSSGLTDCSASTVLMPGATCAIAVAFVPAASGTITGSVVIADNALNSATSTQTIQLSGTGLSALTSFGISGLNSLTAGTAFSLTVDANGGAGKYAGYTGTIHFTSSDPNAVLPADYTYTSTDAGEHVFTGVKLKTSGTQAITVTDTVQIAVAGSASTTVSAGAAASVAVSGSAMASATASTNFAAPLAALVLDAYLNPVSGVAVTFTAPATGARVTFAGGLSQVTVNSNSSGVASSTTLTANATTGSYAVTAAVAGVGMPASFTLTNTAPGAATTVAIVTTPTGSHTYGTAISLQATVTPTVSNAHVPSGTVTFSDGATVIGSQTLNASGIATLSVTPPVGAHPYSASYSGDVNFNGGQMTASAALTITSATLTVTAQNVSKAYSAALPGLTSVISGYVNGDTAAAVSGAATLSTTATVASPVGSYPITAVQGTLAAANYTFTFMPGSLTVTPAILTATVTSQNKIYGAALPAFGATLSGFLNGDMVTAVSGAGAFSTTATAASPVGLYPITTTQGTLTATNYTFTFMAGTLTVVKAQPAVTLTISSTTPAIGRSLTLTATVAAPFTGVATGVVTFFDGATMLGTGAVNATGVATYSTTTLALGAHSLKAAYAGDSNFLTGSSSSTAVTVLNLPDFTLSSTPTALTLQRGQTANYVLTLTPLNKYNGTATVSCGTLPADIQCSFQPATLQANGSDMPLQGLLRITTSGAVAHNSKGPEYSLPASALAGVLMCLLWAGGCKSRHLRGYVWILPLVFLGVTLSGCGVSSQIADAGTTQIAVTAADSTQSISHSLNLSLTLQ